MKCPSLSGIQDAREMQQGRVESRGVSSLQSRVGRVQASLILAQVCRAVCFVWLEDLCIFPIKATCNSNELEDINLRAVNPKKTADSEQKRQRRSVCKERSSAKGNEKSTRCEGGRQKKSRENVKLIKMKLSRTQGEAGRRRGGEGGEATEACNMRFIRTQATVTAQVSMHLRLAN